MEDMSKMIYPVDKLLDRCYAELNKQGVKAGTVKIDLPRLTVSRSANRKETVVTGLDEITELLPRTPEEILNFYTSELSKTGFLSENKTGFILHGVYKDSAINSLLHKYAEKFVFCSICGSLNTTITKHDRIDYLECQKCKSKQAIKN